MTNVIKVTQPNNDVLFVEVMEFELPATMETARGTLEDMMQEITNRIKGMDVEDQIPGRIDFEVLIGVGEAYLKGTVYGSSTWVQSGEGEA